MRSQLEIEVERFMGLQAVGKVEELFIQSNKQFMASSEDAVLERLVEGHDIIVVGGGYFGDEGKGKIVNVLSHHPLIGAIIRANSGENAGHTVFFKGIKYVLHLTPSGIFVPEKICAINSECVMDPVNYMAKEIGPLARQRVNYEDRLFVGNVHLVGPHHKVLDFALSAPNSSTLTGMAYAHASKVMKKGLRLDHLFNDKRVQAQRLEDDLVMYRGLLKEKGKEEGQIIDDMHRFEEETGRKIPVHVYEFLSAKDKIGYVLDLFEKTVVQNSQFPQRGNIKHMARGLLMKHEKLLIESAQSYWLSNATETHWSSSTSAQTHALGTLASCGVNVTSYNTAVVNVLKTPGDSRVGKGANPSSLVPQNYFQERGIHNMEQLRGACDNFDAVQKLYFNSIGENGIVAPTEYIDASGRYSISEAMAIACAKKFGEKGATTGKPRVTGLLDLVAAWQVAQEQGPHLFISALDRGDDQDFVGATVAYVYHNAKGESAESNGRKYHNGDVIRIRDEYPNEQVLQHCYPIVKVMPGWKDTPIGAGRWKKEQGLPQAVQQFLGIVEDLTGFKVLGFGNGPEGKDMVYVKEV